MSRYRVLHIMQYEKNPRTGETLFTQEMLDKFLDHATLTEWAYIWHDHDTYKASHIADLKQRLTEDYIKNEANKKTEEGEVIKSLEDYIAEKMASDYPYVVEGQPKPRHVHIMVKCKSAIAPELVEKWSGIPARMVRAGKGRHAFYDLLKYLTHDTMNAIREQKEKYDPHEVRANFDYIEKMAELDLQVKEYGTELDDDERMRMNVLQGKKTLQECFEENPLIYEKNMERLKKCRLYYLSTKEPPTLRLNYYVDGKGGVGKNVMCRALAQALYPDMKKPFFEVGGTNVTFEGYDGEPVIIWNDTRAVTLIQHFGRGEVFDIFDTHPTSSRHNIKYGSMVLSNTVNIINGIEGYEDFLNSLAGEYKDRYGEERKAEDKGQVYRRFPLIVCLRESDCDILINKGVAEGSRSFEQYIMTRHLQGSFAKAVERLTGEAKEVVIKKMTTPMVEEHNGLISKLQNNKIAKVEDIPEEFLHFGEELPTNGFRPIQSDEEESLPFK